LIKIRDFTFRYNGADKPALRDINLEVGDGEFMLIAGPSGGGKSSLCRCFNGLIPHFYGGNLSGSIEVLGLDVLRQSTKDMATRVGMVFQDPENQLVAVDVEREIAFGPENLSYPRELIARRIEESLDTLGISDLRHRPLQELSGGEKQKVAIASVLSLHPEVLVLDEPTSELDPKSAEDVLSIVQRLNDELGITVILIEHRLDRVVQHTDRIVVLDGGKIIADGRTRDILGRRYSKIAASGIGLPPVIKLAHEIEKSGINVGPLPLTVKEGRAMLSRIFNQTIAPRPRPESENHGKPVISVDKLWHNYSEGRASLKKVSFDIAEGEFVAIMGRNASGKTTLVKHFIGLLKPSKGSVTVAGVDTRKTTVAQLARRVGFIFQNPNDHIFADTVKDEIAFTLKNLGFQQPEIDARIGLMLEKFGLKEYRKQYPRSLSGGERQRVALASVLAFEPKILVLDEPTRGMEYRLKNELMRFLSEYRRKGNTVILVSHDVETVAEHADRVILLSEGEIVVDADKRSALSRALLFSPQINRLAQAFEKYGLPGDTLTVDEVMSFIEEQSD